MVRVAHQAENVLDLFRKNKLEIKSDALDVIFKTRDFIEKLILSIEKKGNDKGLETEADQIIVLIKELENKNNDNDNSEKEVIKEPSDSENLEEAKVESPTPVDIQPIPEQEKPKPKKFGLFSNDIAKEEKPEVKEEKKKVKRNWGLFGSNDSEAVKETKPEDTKPTPPQKKIQQEETIATPSPNPNSKPNKSEIKTENKTESSSTSEIKDIRISTERLDNLMDSIGELVITDAMITRYSNSEVVDLDLLRRSTSQLSKITRNLLELGLSMRMIPIAGLFQKMNRLIRDLGRSTGKQVKCEIRGEDSEIDKTLVEQLSDPLMHIIRNAMDHGMETTEERKMTTKSPVGIVSMEAMHKGSEIWIVIQDDGRGMNREKILKKARDNSLIQQMGVSFRMKKYGTLFLILVSVQLR
jgi:two-component system, chemotaxis family, sensor kinase CheA